MSDTIFRYQPRRGRLWRAAGFLAVLGTIGGWPSLHSVLSATGNADARTLLVLISAVAMLATSIVTAASAILGLPYLSVNSTGLRLQTAFGAKWAAWESLGRVQVREATVGRKRPWLSAAAPIIGPDVSRNLRDKRHLTIPDVFEVPIAVIATELNSRHPQAWAGLRDAAAIQTQDDSFGVVAFKGPWMTWALLLTLTAVFAAELVTAVDPPRGMGLTPRALLAAGGLNRVAVLTDGQWYRVFTAPFLHANFAHIFFNGIALLMAGVALERLVGRAWFLALFFVGALGGSVMSMVLNPANLVSVGASGAIMALFAALFISSYRLPEGPARSRIQMRSIRVLIPSLLPLATTAGAVQIDYGAHIGGALIGGAAGWLLLRNWPEASRLPNFQDAAKRVAVVGIVVCIASFAAVTTQHHSFRLVARLIPTDELPKTAADVQAEAASLAERYPLDPRSHLLLSMRALAAHDVRGAAQELRTSMRVAGQLPPAARQLISETTRPMISAVLMGEGQAAQVKELARILCNPTGTNSADEALRAALAKNHLCE